MDVTAGAFLARLGLGVMAILRETKTHVFDWQARLGYCVVGSQTSKAGAHLDHPMYL